MHCNNEQYIYTDWNWNSTFTLISFSTLEKPFAVYKKELIIYVILSQSHREVIFEVSKKRDKIVNTKVKKIDQ